MTRIKTYFPNTLPSFVDEVSDYLMSFPLHEAELVYVDEETARRENLPVVKPLYIDGRFSGISIVRLS